MSYSEKLRDPRWQKKRLKILERDKWRCQYCGNTKDQLQVHHTLYSNCEPWDEAEENLKTICLGCHNAIQKLKDKTILDEMLGREFSPRSISNFLTALDNKNPEINEYLLMCAFLFLAHDKTIFNFVADKIEKYDGGENILSIVQTFYKANKNNNE